LAYGVLNRAFNFHTGELRIECKQVNCLLPARARGLVELRRKLRLPQAPDPIPKRQRRTRPERRSAALAHRARFGLRRCCGRGRPRSWGIRPASPPASAEASAGGRAGVRFAATLGYPENGRARLLRSPGI
jgi:hypothetical protein